jgi:hypothetical protein
MSCCAPSTRVVCLPLRCLSALWLRSYTIVIRYPNRTSLGLFIFRFHCAPAAELHVSGASCAPGARGAQRQTDSAHATTDIEMSYVTTAHTNHHVDVTVGHTMAPATPGRRHATQHQAPNTNKTRHRPLTSPHLTATSLPRPGARESEEPRPSLTPPPTRSPIFALAMCRECHRSAWLTLSLLPAPRRH